MASVSDLVKSGFPHTLASLIGFDDEILEAAGSTQSDATQITLSFSRVINANGTKGVRLPTFEASKSKLHIVFNDSSSNLKIYPAVNERLNSVTADLPKTILAGNGLMIIKMDIVTSDIWIGFTQVLL